LPDFKLLTLKLTLSGELPGLTLREMLLGKNTGACSRSSQGNHLIEYVDNELEIIVIYSKEIKLLLKPVVLGMMTRKQLIPCSPGGTYLDPRDLEQYLHEHIPLSKAMQVTVIARDPDRVVLSALWHQTPTPRDRLRRQHLSRSNVGCLVTITHSPHKLRPQRWLGA